MKILERRTFRGPNVYALFPVIRLTVNLEALEERPSNSIEGFTDRLLEVLPELRDHKCCFHAPGGFVRRLREGTWMGHILEHVAIALQNLVGQSVSFGKTRGQGERGCYYVVFSCRDVGIGELAAEAGHELLVCLLPKDLGGKGPDSEAARDTIEGFERAVRKVALGPSTAALVAEAERRGIPHRRIGPGSLIQLGHGRHRRRLWGTVSGRTAAVGVDIACDKAIAHEVMKSLGLPVPRQWTVRSADEAAAVARGRGYPIVFKPKGGNHGRGVVIVRHENELAAAYEAARRVGPVVAEEWLAGHDHRLLIVGGRLVAAAMRMPGHVVGDGVQSVEALVHRVNEDPRRGEGHGNVQTRIEIDEEAHRMLAREGLSLDDVPEPGRRVYLRETANLSTGGTAIDVTDDVHPDNAEAAIRAARAVDLDIAGVDFIMSDISKSHRDVGGGICEINAGPGLRMHLQPAEGESRDVARPIVDLLFPPGRSASIPIAMVTGTNGKTTTVRMLSAILEEASVVVGMTTTDGVHVGGRCVQAGDFTGPAGATMVLDDPSVDAAVLEVARGGILRAGLAVPACNVAAVTNVTADHLGLGGVNTLDELAHVKSVVAEVATDAVVLNAEDPRVRAMWNRCRARKAIWICPTTDPVELQETMGPGHYAIGVRRNGHEVMVAVDEDAVRPILPVPAMPSALGGLARHNVENAMFAAGLAWAMGVPLVIIRHALEHFVCSAETTPGRLNIFERHGIRVIVDYGHNPAGFRRVGEMISAMDCAGHRICVAGMAGDRRDEDFGAAAAVLARHFDRYICRGEKDPRGRGHNELPELMAHGLRQAGIGAASLLVEPDELEATRHAMRIAQPGDLVVIFAVQIGATCELVRSFLSSLDEAGLTAH